MSHTPKNKKIAMPRGCLQFSELAPLPVGEGVYRNKIFINQYITQLLYFYFSPILPHKLLPKILNTGTLKSHVVYVVGVVYPYFS